MSTKLHLVLLFLGTLLFNSSVEHPLKLTSSEIKYDKKTKNITVNCRVFIDDFAPVISSVLFLKLQNNENLSEEEKNKIEQYFKDKYRIFINNKRLPLKFEDHTVAQNVMNIKFSKYFVSLNKGDEIYVENELLFEEFEYQQSNWMTFNIPPFVINQSFESTFGDFSYTHKF